MNEHDEELFRIVTEAARGTLNQLIEECTVDGVFDFNEFLRRCREIIAGFL